MNLAQMGVKYSTDKRGRTSLVPMKPQEQEAPMKNHKRSHAKAMWLAKKAREAAAQKKAA